MFSYAAREEEVKKRSEKRQRNLYR
ncbi:uncharacterized, partial [Tachysurus ichikawai]